MIKKFKSIAICVTIILCIGTLSGCTTYDNFVEGFFGDGTKQDSIKIALYEPISGEFSDEAAAEIRGIELANKLFPEVLGKKVELVYADNGSDLNTAKTALENLAENKPAIVLGSYGSAFSMLAGSVFEEAKIPALTITNTNPLVNSNNPYYFRVCFVEAYQGKALADFTTQILLATQAAVLLPQGDDYAMALSTTYSEKLVALTANPNVIVSTQNYNPGDPDFSKQLAEIKKSGATVVFLPGGINDAQAIIAQAKKMGLNLTFLGTESWATDEFIQPAISAGLSNYYFPTAYDSANMNSEMSDIFLKAYQKEYGSGEPEEATALGFDAYLLAIDAITRAGTADNGEKIIEALSGVVDFQGASGVIRFDAQGDPERSVIINNVQGTLITPVYTVSPVPIVTTPVVQ
jgi:branched-chain amino acid transport system substrate-binding protein